VCGLGEGLELLWSSPSLRKPELRSKKPYRLDGVQRMESYLSDGLELNALLGRILCPFIGIRAWFTMHGSHAYLYHIFG
jgi:hypothetical protein